MRHGKGQALTHWGVAEALAEATEEDEATERIAATDELVIEEVTARLDAILLIEDAAETAELATLLDA